MDVLFTGFITVVLITTLIQAVRIHKQYTNAIYPALFSNYLEYFYRYYFRQNLSISNWIKQELGFHRIIYNSLVDKNGTITESYVTILCRQGMYVIRDIRSSGKYSGKKNDKYWIINKTDKHKIYRILNPQSELNNHIIYQFQKLNLNGQGIISFNNDADLTMIKSTYPVLHYNEVISYIKSQPELLNEQQILTAFKLGNK